MSTKALANLIFDICISMKNELGSLHYLQEFLR